MKAENPPATVTPGTPKEPRKKAPGHGRNGAAAYPGAKRIPVPLEGEASGEPCPECPKAEQKKPEFNDRFRQDFR